MSRCLFQRTIVTDFTRSTLKSARKWSQNLLGSLQVASPIRDRLENLRQRIPELQESSYETALPQNGSGSNKNTSRAPLHFAFLITQLFLHRALLRPCKGRATAPPAASQDIFSWQDATDANSLNDGEANQEYDDMAQVATAAEACAEQIVAFTEKLDSIDAAAFWHSCKLVQF